jgi:hypothetical protein
MSLRGCLQHPWKASTLANWSPNRMRRTVADIATLYGQRPARVPQPFVLAQIQSSIATTWGAHRSLETVGRHDRKWLPHVMFLTPGKGVPPLAADDRFVQAILRYLRENPRRLAAAIWVFLRDFPQQLSTFHSLRVGFKTILGETDLTQLALWRVRNDRFRLLEKDGPSTVAELVFDDEQEEPSALFDSAGLTGELAAGGFARRVDDALMIVLERELREHDVGAVALDRPLAFAEPSERTLRFPDRAPVLATALLRPFDGKEPLAATKSRIQSFVLKHLSDPRIVPLKWQLVDESARRVMLKWLVVATLDDFFRLIEKFAWMEHWRYRRAFWTAYVEQNVIDDAWVVLGEDAQQAARQVFRRSGASFGKLRSSGDKKHSVLLMRIGDLVIAEWSHNGTCRVWASDSDAAPQLHGFDYTGAQLREDSDFDQRHQGSDTYAWQRSLAEFIRRQTGIQMSAREYRV